MVIIYIICVLALIVALVLYSTLRLHFSYDGTIRLSIGILFINHRLLPEKKNKPKYKPEKAKQRKSKPEKQSDSALDELKKDLSPHELLTVLRKYFASAPKELERHLHVKLNKLYVSVAAEDPAQTAVYYGVVSQAASYLLEILRCRTNFDCGEVYITSDFLGNETKAEIDIKLKVRIFFILKLIVRMLLDIIRAKENKKQTKGTEK